MTIDYAKVKRICSASEFALVESARPASLSSMRASTLKSKANQARRQFDKWSDQTRKQNRAIGGASDGANERSLLKKDVFQEILARFEKQLAKVEKAEAAKKAAPKPKPAKKPVKKAAKKSQPPKKKVAAAAAAKSPLKKGKTDEAAKEAPGRTEKSMGNARVQNTRVQQSGLTTRTRGHVSAQGRRNQARRNTR